MTPFEKKLNTRSQSKCEISGAMDDLVVYTVAPKTEESLDNCLLIAQSLKNQLDNPEMTNPADWHGLHDSMWSEHLPVQIVSWRMLMRLKKFGLLESMYLDEDALEWAKATGEGDDEANAIVHKDVNGARLKDGDSVVLIKDLDVKGAHFTAKRGAAVHNIKLVWDNAQQIEGRLEGQSIVILTQYVKKTK